MNKSMINVNFVAIMVGAWTAVMVGGGTEFAFGVTVASCWMMLLINTKLFDKKSWNTK